MVRTHHQDRTIAGIFHDVFHQAADGNATILLRQRHTQNDQVKFTLLNLFNDCILRVSNPDLALGRHAKHFQAFHAAGDKAFHALALIVVCKIAMDGCK